MAYLVKADLVTHQYGEYTDEITRSTDSIVDAAIAEAIDTAKGYLSKFNRTKLFDPNATGFVTSVKLKSVVKDITIWRLLQLVNINADMEKARLAFEDAMSWLKDVQKGMVDPEGWPQAADDADTDRTEGDVVSYVSNDKRTNHY